MQTEKVVLVSLVVLALAVVGYVLYTSTTQPSATAPLTTLPLTTMQQGATVPPMKMAVEAFESPADQVSVSSGMQGSGAGVDASEAIQYVEQPQGLGMELDGTQMLNQLPSECYPKDVLSSADLLPRDANSLWAQVNPSGQGSLADQNFLTAGFHIGINTVGQTLRNANRQLRSEPLNPQVKVSPWMQTTIEPDINRRPLEIQGDL
jgi:hypothetical protein